MGKRIDRSLRDTIAIQETKDNLEKWLTKVDKSGLQGRFKSWIYRHTILLKILWPLSIYEFTMAHIEQMERKINSCLRGWLGLPECLSSAAIYGNTTALHLPFRSLIEEFKVTKIRTALLYKLSKDEKMSGPGIEIYSDRKWEASRELQVVEERLREKAILGTVVKGRAGLGFFATNRVDKSSYKSKRRLIQDEVRKEDEIRLTKMVGLK